MKRSLLFLLLVALLIGGTSAQRGKKIAPQTPGRPGAPMAQMGPKGPKGPMAQPDEIILRAVDNETFMVYLDGNPYTRKAEKQVSLPHLSAEEHEITVLLQKPANKVVTFIVRPNEFGVREVAYNRRDNSLAVIVPHQYEKPIRHGKPVINQPKPGHPVPAPEVVVIPEQQTMVIGIATEGEVNDMVYSLTNETFDKTRLLAAKNMVSSKPLTSNHIRRMADTFTFNSNRKEFLIYAFEYCVDPENYYQAIETLIFASDREELLKLITR